MCSSDLFETKFLIRGNDGGELLRTQAQLLQAQLKKVGINMTLDITPDKASGAKRLYAGDFDLIAINKALYGDVDSFLYATYYSTSAANYSFVVDPEVDRLIEVALDDLLHPDVVKWEVRRRTRPPEVVMDVPYFDVADHRVWGATAMVLSEFVAVVTQAEAETDASASGR